MPAVIEKVSRAVRRIIRTPSLDLCWKARRFYAKSDRESIKARMPGRQNVIFQSKILSAFRAPKAPNGKAWANGPGPGSRFDSER